MSREFCLKHTEHWFRNLVKNPLPGKTFEVNLSFSNIKCVPVGTSTHTVSALAHCWAHRNMSWKQEKKGTVTSTKDPFGVEACIFVCNGNTDRYWCWDKMSAHKNADLNEEYCWGKQAGSLKSLHLELKLTSPWINPLLGAVRMLQQCCLSKPTGKHSGLRFVSWVTQKEVAGWQYPESSGSRSW